jgi:hypothetical protein
MADGDNPPIFVSPEIGEGETARHLQRVSVLRRERHSRRERGQDDNGDCGPYAQHGAPPVRRRLSTQFRAGGEAGENST